jgi:hypothetical protein
MRHELESLESRRLLAGTGAISGSVYNDVDADARHDAGEAGLRKVRVYLDTNNNGALDRRERSAITDKRGQFRFDGLEAGTYRLRQVVDANKTIVSAPRSSWFRITLADGQHVARRQFANVSVVRVPGENGLPDQFIHGSTIANTDTLIKFTFHGDSDFNGVVNFDDYSRIDSAFNVNTGWFNGDFDYNGVVNFDDYHLIDQAFLQQGNVITRPPAQPPITPPKVLTAKEQASVDVTLNRTNYTLSQSISWLSGNKNVARSRGVQAAIDGYHKFGIDYKREFLRLGNS